MQYIEYCKINQNRHLFVKLPTQVKYKRFGKKTDYIKQKATGRGHFCPQPFFSNRDLNCRVTIWRGGNLI